MDQKKIEDTQLDHEATRKPTPGDIICARYRWSQDGDEEPGKKIRPCMVIKAAPDGSSMIIAPISTKQAWNANDCVEIMPEHRKDAGLTEGMRSWVKLTEINRVDLPNLAVIPQVLPDGRMAWSRGRVPDKVLEHVQSEIAYRVHDKTLTGKHIKSDKMPTLQLAGIRVIKKDEQDRPEIQEAPSSQSRLSTEQQSTIERRAADFAEQNALPQPKPRAKAPADHAR